MGLTRWPIQGHGLSLEVRVGDSGLLRRLPLHALGWTRQVSLHLPTCNASLRVSLYFRTRRRLEQAFNSLDAQRETCTTYFASQKAEGVE